MNFIFVSPHFPKTYWNFCDRLHRNGVNVLGIGDAPFDEIPWELKQCLTEYYRVNDLGNYDEMLRAVAYFTFHYGKIDWIESNNEYWLEMDAQLRTDFNINTGAKNDFIERIKYKSKMKESYIAAGVPVARYHIVSTLAEARAFIKEVGYPVIVKATAGGDGKGMKIAFNDEEMKEAYTMARAEAKAAFTSDVVYMEKYLQKPRHIEMQILADKYGHVVHLGERDCSIQRSNQKVIEECPSPALNNQQRREIGEIVRKAIEKIGYTNAGTLEFLYEDGRFYFMEMNTRLQVEHPITEAVTGIDIVREQIRIASGASLGYTQDDITFSGHAIECRINAEDPETFVPCPGKITEWHAPGGLGIRVDSEIYSGYSIPPFYDSMIAKLIVHGKTRNAALMRLRRALEEFVIEGVKTTIPLHQEIISQAEFIDGQYNIHWLEKFMEKMKQASGK